MKKLLALLLALLLCVSFSACGNGGGESNVTTTGSGVTTTGSNVTTTGSDDYWANAETMKIAVLGPLTGAGKENGDRARRSVDYAVEQINADGGVLGKPIEAVYFDIGADQQGFVNALQAAVNTKGISATIGYVMSPFTIAGAEIIRESEIPNITMGNSAGIIALKNPYIWQLRIPDKVSTTVLAKIGYETYGVKNPAVVWMTNASGQSQHDAYLLAMEGYGATIAADIGFDNTTTSDFNPIMTKVMNSNSDGLILFCTNQQDGILIAETVKQFNYPNPIGTSPGNFSYAFLDLLSDSAADGWYGVSEFNLDADTPGLAEYLAGLNERDTLKFGRPGWNETSYYDAMFIFAQVAETAGSFDPKLINEAMTQIKDFQGMMSSYSYHEDHSLANYCWLAQIQGNDILFKEQVNRD